MVQSVCSWNGGGGGGKDTGSLKDREAKKCQKEVEREGQTRQTQIDGARGSTQVQFPHAGGKTGNNNNNNNRETQTVKPVIPSNLIMMKHFLIIAYHLRTHRAVDKKKEKTR